MKPHSRTASAATLVLAALLCTAATGDEVGPAGSRVLDAEVAQLSATLSAPAGSLEPRLARLLDQAVDWEGLAQRTFGEYLDEYLQHLVASYERPLEPERVEGMTRHYRTLVARALRQRAVHDLAEAARARQAGGLVTVSNWVEEDHGLIDLAVQRGDSVLSLQGQVRRAGGAWHLSDLAVAGRWVSEHYREECRQAMVRAYSPEVLESCLLQRDYIVLEDFDDTPAGDLPPDWGVVFDKDKGKPMPYQVEQGGCKPYLAARDSSLSIIIGKLVHWNPREFPILTWCWRVDALPEGGDERSKDTNDSAAGIYVIFSRTWLGAPRQLKYVWSSSLPAGTVDRRPQAFRPWFYVMESGAGKLGRWTFEQVDLYAQHEQKLGGKPDSRTIGLSILTDANSTNSYAEAAYADIRVWTREALEAGRVNDYCDCLSSAPPGPGRSPGGH